MATRRAASTGPTLHRTAAPAKLPSQVVELLELSLLDVERVFSKLASGIPASLPRRDIGSDRPFMGIGRPQRRAAGRYTAGLEPGAAGKFYNRNPGLR